MLSTILITILFGAIGYYLVTTAKKGLRAKKTRVFLGWSYLPSSSPVEVEGDLAKCTNYLILFIGVCFSIGAFLGILAIMFSLI